MAVKTSERRFSFLGEKKSPTITEGKSFGSTDREWKVGTKVEKENAKLLNAIDWVFSDKDPLGPIMDLYISIYDPTRESRHTNFRAGTFLEPLNKIQIPKGISRDGVKLVAKTLLLVIRHPIRAFRMIRTKLDPELQKAILSRDSIWRYLSKHSDRVAAVAALNKSAIEKTVGYEWGVKEVLEIDEVDVYGFVDKKSLTALEAFIANPDNISAIKDIAHTFYHPIEVKYPMTGKRHYDIDLGVRPDFVALINAIRNVEEINKLAEKLNLKPETVKALKETLALDGFKDMENIDHLITKLLAVERVRDLLVADKVALDRFVDWMKISSEATALLMGERSELAPVLKAKSGLVQQALEAVAADEKGGFRVMLDSMDIDPDVLKITSRALSKRQPELVEILNGIYSKPLFFWVKDIVDLACEDEVLKAYIKANPEKIGRVVRGVIKSDPGYLTRMMEDIGIPVDILDVVDIALKEPELVKPLIDAMVITLPEVLLIAKPSRMVDTMIARLEVGNPDQKSLAIKLNQQDVKAAILVVLNEKSRSIPDKFQADALTSEIVTALVYTGKLEKAEAEALMAELGGQKLNMLIAAATPLIDDPTIGPGIQNFLKERAGQIPGIVMQFVKYDHLASTVYRADLEAMDPPVRFELGDIKTIQQMFDDYGIGEEIMGAIPLFLQHPESISRMATLYRDGKIIEAADEVFKLINTDSKIQDFFKRKSGLIKTIAMNVVKKTPALAAMATAYDVDDKVFDIIPLFLKYPKELNSVYQEYRKGDYYEASIKFFNLMENNPEIRKFFQDNSKLFERIMVKVVDNNPALKEQITMYAKGASVENLAARVLANPAWASALVVNIKTASASWEKGDYSTLITSGLSAATQATTFSLSEIGTYVYTGIVGDKETGALIEKLIKPARAEKIKLGELFEAKLTDSTITNVKAVREKLLRRKSLDNITYTNPNFANLIIDSYSIINCKFDGGVFKGSKLAKVSLANSTYNKVIFEGVEFEKCSFTSSVFNGCAFKGVKFDQKSFDSFVEAVNANKTKVKLVGDYRGLSFKGVDLTYFDFSEAKITQDQLEEAENLQRATLPAEHKDAMKKVAKSRTTDQVAGAVEMDSKKLKTMLEALPEWMQEYTFSVLPLGSRYVVKGFRDREEHKKSDVHFSTMDNSPSLMLSDIKESKGDAKAFAKRVAANLLANELTHALFGDAYNRAKDALALQDFMLKTIPEDVKAEEFFKFEEGKVALKAEFKALIDQLAVVYRGEACEYTAVGMATGGIRFKVDPKTREIAGLTDKLLKYTHEHIAAFEKEAAHGLTAAEEKLAKDIGQRIGFGLFQEGAKTDRVTDVARLEEHVKGVLVDLKGSGKDLGVLKGHVADIAGKMESGWFGKTRTGLCEVYYGQTKYTTAGLVGGGIYMPEEFATLALTEAVKGKIETHISEHTR